MFIFAVLYVGLEGQVQCDNLTYEGQSKSLTMRAESSLRVEV